MDVSVSTGEAAVVAATARPLTRRDVATALREVGVLPGAVIIVHSSLSRLGWIVGGAQSVVEAIRDAVGPTGTIVMPAQTGISDPAGWMNPPVDPSWWNVIRDESPAFDVHLTPLRGMGATVECLQRLPGVCHSGHPSVGFIAHGPDAQSLLAGHGLESGLGDDSPLGALYRADATIVLLGVGHANNTSLHLAEHRADYPGKRNLQDGAPMLVDGERRWVTYSDLDRDSDDFEALGEAFVAAGGKEARATLGNGTVRACAVREIVDFAVGWLPQHRSASSPGGA